MATNDPIARRAKLKKGSPLSPQEQDLTSDPGRYFRDYQANQFAKNAANKFSKGTFTASQTGARQLAETRNPIDAAMTRSNQKPIKKGLMGGY